MHPSTTLSLAFLLSSTPTDVFSLRLDGDALADRFGSAVGSPGDLDGDGVPDFVVGAPHADRPGLSSGLVRAFSGADGATLWEARGASAGEWLGSALEGVGDVDGDGHPDVLVGAPVRSSANGVATGAALLLSGRDGALLAELAGASPGERFGAAVAGVGDTDFDGVPDFAVGAPASAAGGLLAGRATLFSGATRCARFVWDGSLGDQLGSALAAPGDLDGDGCGDVLIGAPFADEGAFNAGRASARSGFDGRELWAASGDEIGAWLGASLAAAGDTNGDGLPDVVIGVPGLDAAGIDSGALEVRSGVDGALLLCFPGAGPGLYAGVGAGLGDLDGDGCAEIAFASPSERAERGRVRVLSGRDGALLAQCDGAETFDWLGFALAPLGDMDGDGLMELLLGAPGHDDVLDRTGSAFVLSSGVVLARSRAAGRWSPPGR